MLNDDVKYECVHSSIQLFFFQSYLNMYLSDIYLNTYLVLHLIKEEVALEGRDVIAILSVMISECNYRHEVQFQEVLHSATNTSLERRFERESSYLQQVVVSVCQDCYKPKTRWGSLGHRHFFLRVLKAKSRIKMLVDLVSGEKLLSGLQTAALSCGGERMHAKSHQSCLTFCYPMDCSPQSSSVHEILQTRILEWVAMPSSSGSS